MIVHVDQRTVEKVWGLMEGGLSRAFHNTSLGSYWDLDSGLQGIKDGELMGFYVPESQYSGVYSFTQSPHRKALRFWWSGKDESNTVPIDFKEVDEYLSIIAEAFGCQVIECEGRKGWRPILGPLGYQEDSILYTREVSNELSKIR